MSDLKASVQSAIAAYVQSKQETHAPVDVLRMIRDQASLLYERQVVCDTLDADPMQQLSEVKKKVKRIQSLMEVVSCTRVVTLDGYTRHDAVVEWKRDDRMVNVTSNVQLTFHYEQRRKQSDIDDSSRILYTIDIAKDYGQKQRLLVIEVFATGDGPSAMPAEPLDEDDEWEDADDDDAMDAESEPPVVETVNNKQEEKPTQDCDRFAAYLDPDVLANLLEWTQLGMDEYTTFFFLMTFPFYEHEWDLVGFALDSVFGEAMDEDEQPEVIQVEKEEDDAASSPSIESAPQVEDDGSTNDDDSDL